MFKKFSVAIHTQFTAMSKRELYVVSLSKDDIWNAYLAAFPEDTNLIYKERTEHDCNCCSNFVKNLGNVVSVVDGKLQSVWGVDGLESPYREVAEALDKLVTSSQIEELFRSKEPSYGVVSNKQMLTDGTVKQWNHFFGKISSNHATQEPDKARGEYKTTANLFKRGLEEISSAAIETVLNLIQSKSIYRGEEHQPAIKAFQTLQTAYANAENKNIFVWANAMSPAARFRNTVIGTLVQDLSEGVALERAVSSFEAKVAPSNYKRTKALITPSMIQSAMKTVEGLGLAPSLERRFAQMSDITVNNVLWVDNTVKPAMKGGLESLLQATVSKAITKVGEPTAISIEDFMSKVLPTATSIDMLVKNKHQGNFMSLTAPMHEDSKQLFKWTNDFGWSYDGNITDSDIRRAVQGRGGRVDGVFRFSHSWNYDKRNASLMDLHVFMPGNTKSKDSAVNTDYGIGRRVGWNRRTDSASGGVQDVDYTTAAPEGYIPVENITFPQLNRMPEGKYLCMVHNWALRQPTQGGFKAEIEFEGQVFEYEVDRPLAYHEWVAVATATLKNEKFSIEHHLPYGATSTQAWGVATETAVKVKTVMYSPNYWDDNAVGNKHWFFILDQCKNPNATRGIYNEFLSNKLAEHSKVFEVLGDKTKCQPTEEQLSGLGFSSTKSDSVTLVVTSGSQRRSYTVNF